MSGVKGRTGSTGIDGFEAGTGAASATVSGASRSRWAAAKPPAAPSTEETPMNHDATTRGRWLALYVLCLGDLMIVLDSSIVNVALPSIQTDLGFSASALAW